jgi:hypothetical protein
MKTLLFLFSLFTLPAEATPRKSALELLPGSWVMHLYLRDNAGKPRLFDDQVTIGRDGPGLKGQLVVPKAFTAQLENFRLDGRHFAFEIEADEGRGKFRVRYEGDFHRDDDETFAGFADVLAPSRQGRAAPEQGLLGGFVGQRLE